MRSYSIYKHDTTLKMAFGANFILANFNTGPPIGECAKAIAPCSRSLASYRGFCPMAVRRSECRSPSQQSAGVGGRDIKAGTV